MTLISIDLHKMSHWIPAGVFPGRFSVPADMVLPALASLPCTCGNDLGPGCKCHCLQGVRVNDIDPLPPWNHFRKVVLTDAREFRRRMKQQSLEFHAITPEADMLVYGPYHHKETQDIKHLTAFGRQGDENLYPDRLDFKLWCEFTQKYARGGDDGPGRPKWALDFWAKVDTEMERERRLRESESRGDLILAKR